MVSQRNIWEHFGMTASQCSLLPVEDKTTMLQRYYLENLSVYYGNGKIFWECFGCCKYRDMANNLKPKNLKSKNQGQCC